MRCSHLNICTFISILCVALIPIVFSDSRNIFLSKLENCKGLANASLNWSDFTLKRDSTTKDFTFSLKLVVLKEVSTKFGMEFNLWKCDNTGSLDSCEYFLKEYRNDNICNYMVKKRQFWSVFLEHFTPTLVCPFKPGTYNGKDIPFKSDFLRFLPIQDGVWRARFKGFDKGTTIGCADIEMKVSKERRRG